MRQFFGRMLPEHQEIWMKLDGQLDGIMAFKNWMEMDKKMDAGFSISTLKITPEILGLIAEIDEFKGAWKAIGRIAPERLSGLRRVATIESIGSSTRIEGAKLSDREVERLLSNIGIKSFATRDEQEVAGYAAVMETVFASWREIALTENHIKQIHRDLLQYSSKDERHRGDYKTLPNHVEAFGADVYRVLDDEPERVREVLPEGRASRILEARREELKAGGE